VTLRALVLGRPAVNAAEDLAADYERRKRRFLSEPNFCSVRESNELLIIYPELWEDHALLLAGKGEERTALEFLRELGTHAPRDDDRKARAAVKMMRPELVAEFVGWVLERHPGLGVEAVVRALEAGALSLDASVRVVEPSGNEASLLETLIARGRADAANRLARVYADAGNRKGIARLLRGDLVLAWDALLEPLKGAGWTAELAMALDKLGRRTEAAEALAGKGDDDGAAAAEAYAAGTGDARVLMAVFNRVLQASGAHAALAMAARHEHAVDALQVLTAMGDEMALEGVINLVRAKLEVAESKHRDHLVRFHLRGCGGGGGGGGGGCCGVDAVH